ncbi:glycosyl transferase family 1, partial [Cellulomonas bogoriensis 69B4 = DSM 16987]
VPAPPRPQAAPRDSTRRALAIAQDAPVMVTVGRLAPQKGLDLLCDAASSLLGRPGLTWLVAGDGPLEAAVRDRVGAEGLPVRLLGRREDVADLMAAADVVVSTARWEGQPLGIQEALALGSAVVATDVGGTAEVTGDAAVLVGTDGEEIGRAVAALLDDPDARAALSARARTRAAQLPDLEVTLDQLEGVYRRTGTRAAPGAAGRVGYS